jgi:integrase
MTVGNITRRGAASWRLKFEAGVRDPVTGARRTRFVTVQGTKKAAQRELIRLLAEVENGTAVDPSRVTVAEYLRGWLDSDRDLSPKTLERYRQLVDQQIVPHLGATLLQKLRPAQVHDWHAILLKSGGKDGRPLAARTVGHAHRVLHRGFERAIRLETVGRNPAHIVPPPKPEAEEIAILSAEQIADVPCRLEGHPLHPIVTLALSTGMRRGELCGLPWGALDLDGAVVRVERSLEETESGLRFKPPKTRHGRRSISLPPQAVETMRAHRRHQLEYRLVLGLGKLGSDDLVFPLPDGSPYPPDKLSRDWGNVVRDKKLPRVTFHALRHSHASALIAAGIDIVTVSGRLGHGSPAITLTVYAHAFHKTDAAAARAIEAALAGVPGGSAS